MNHRHNRRNPFTPVLAALLAFQLLLTACTQGTGSSSSDAPSAPGSTASQASSPAAEPGSGEKRADQITIAIQAEPDTLNPYNVSGAYGDPINDVLYDKFFDISYQGELIPRLCTSYETETDDQGRTVLTFHMAEDAKWQDGQPVTAADVVFTAQTVTNPDTVTTRRFYWSSLDGTDDSGVCTDPSKLGIEALDEHTVRYTLKGPRAVDAYLIIEGRFQYILPKHLLGEVPPAQLHQDAFWQKPVGSGPFLFDSMSSGERYELVCNADYYQGKPKMDRLVFAVMEPSNYAAALSSGGIDANTQLSEIMRDDWEFVQTIPGIETRSITSYTYQWMNINQSRDYFKDARVRQAISFAINRQAIVDQLLAGEGMYAVSSITPSSPYFNDKIAADPYNPEKAKELLEQAGWDFNRVLDFPVPIGNKVREDSAVLIQQDLAKVGIKSEIRMVDFAAVIVQMRDGDFDLGLLGGSGADPDDVRLNFNIDGANNFSHLDTMEFYEILDKARSVSSVEERKQLYAQWQELCYEQTPIVWLYHPNTLFAYHGEKFENYPCEDSLANNLRVMEWSFK